MQQIFVELEGTSAWSNENFQHWQNVAAFNNGVNSSRKLQVIGIDVEHQDRTALRYLNSLLPSSPLPIAITSIISELQNQLTLSNPSEGLEEFARELVDSLDTKTTDFQLFLGNDFFYFDLVSRNLINKFDFIQSGFRDDLIIENFMKVYPLLESYNFFGQWGASHVFQGGRLDEQLFLAEALQHNDDSPVKGQVVSSIIFYEDSFSRSRSGDISNLDSNFCFYPDILSDITLTNRTILRMNASNTPFNINTVFVRSSFYSGVLTEMYKYAIIIKNSQAVIPFGN